MSQEKSARGKCNKKQTHVNNERPQGRKIKVLAKITCRVDKAGGKPCDRRDGYGTERVR